MISCRLLGPVEVAVNAGAPPPELLWRKNLALLVYLARSPKRARAREHLIGLLWSEKPDPAARHSLNEALRIVRRCAGKAAIRTRADQVTLDGRAVELDTERFDALAAVGDWAGAAGLVSGEFLEGFVVSDALEFETWLAAERVHWRRCSVDALVRLAEQQLTGGAVEAAISTTERALALDPVSEATARALIRGRALAGDRAGALAVFDGFAARLADTVGAEPDVETAALAERVRRARAVGSGHAPSSAPGSRRAPLTGRAWELAAVLGVWNECRANRRAGLVIIEGDDGAGKSRLADEAIGRARLDGAAVVITRAVAADGAEPESGLCGIARGGLLEAPGLAAVPASALAACAARLSEWAERFPTHGATGELPPLAAALREVLRAVTAEQAVVLLLDDAHWLDAESLRWLEATARDLSRAPLWLVVTTTTRPWREELDALRARFHRDLFGRTVRLAPLSPADLRELARWALPQYAEPELDRVTRRIATDSAGLPLLAVELLHAVAGGLDLNKSAAAWPAPAKTLDQSLPGDLPDSVVGAIRVGFHRLSPDAQAVLCAAAVLGERVASPLLGRSTGLEGPALTAALDEAEWQRWLSFDARGYAFVARIVQQVVASDMVLPGQRERILQAAGP